MKTAIVVLAILYVALVVWLASLIPAAIMGVIGFVAVVAAGLCLGAWPVMVVLAGAMRS